MSISSTFNAQAVVNHIVQWLKTYAEKAAVKGYVVGISGGIDSALVSTLCAKTGLETLCVEMPIHQAANQVLRAQEHISWLEECFNTVKNAQTDLTSVFEIFKEQVPISFENSKLNLTLANTRARLRMTTLYYYAGINNFLVAGTGNKIEDFGVGFFTKYGDGGVDVSPIADLTKSEVYALAEYLKISEQIQNAAPTDGLFGDDRTDEDQLGATYPELEMAMLAHEQGKSLDDFKGREKEVFEIYQRLNTINQHKMQPIPVCFIPSDFK